jgi:hypothetical protein
MVDGTAISSRKEVGGLNRTAEETTDGWMEAMAASLHGCVSYLSGAKLHGLSHGQRDHSVSHAAAADIAGGRRSDYCIVILLLRPGQWIPQQDIHRLPFIHPDEPATVQ